MTIYNTIYSTFLSLFHINLFILQKKEKKKRKFFLLILPVSQFHGKGYKVRKTRFGCSFVNRLSFINAIKQKFI